MSEALPRVAVFLVGMFLIIMARRRQMRALPWRALVDPHNKSTLLVVAREAADPDGVLAMLAGFSSIAELYAFAFNPARGYERLMLWRSASTDDGAPFVRLPGESADACRTRLEAELTVPEAEKLLLPARRASVLQTYGVLFVLTGVSAAFGAMAFFMPTGSTAPSGVEAPVPQENSEDWPPAEELCRAGQNAPLCAIGKTTQRALNGRDCPAARTAVVELRAGLDALPTDEQGGAIGRAVRTLERRIKHRCP